MTNTAKFGEKKKT